METAPRIEGIRFDKAGGSFSGNLLLDELAKGDGRIRIQGEGQEGSDIVVLNLDAEFAPGFLADDRLGADAYKVFLIHELNRGNIAYLKRADLVIYGSPHQKMIVEEFLGLKYESHVIPFPCLVSGNSGLPEGFVVIGETFVPDSGGFVEEVMESFYRWFSRANVRLMYLCMPVPDEFLEDLEARIQDFEHDHFIRVKLVNRKHTPLGEILKLASRCACGEYFRREISNAQFEDFLPAKDLALLYEKFIADPLISSMAKMGWTRYNRYPGISAWFLDHPGEIPGVEAYRAELLDRIESGFRDSRRLRKRAPDYPPVDTLASLDIIHGRPLSNRYLFSVCFRNQAEKLPRCIRSILSQQGAFDFGIAFVDDHSSDGSSDIILEECRGRIEDFVLVRNRERKFASRNFYNVVRLLAPNPETVIIELDGDDFLAGDRVLEILDGHYAKGCVKTIGSYELFPEAQTFATRETHRWVHENVDIRKPWSVAACNSWLPLRSTKAWLLKKVEIEHFLERTGGRWLKERHDSAIHPRAIELSEGRTITIKEALYMYDVSGADHDHDIGFDELKLFHSLDRFYGPFTLT